ncbi:MAG: hypothetical protein ACPF9W_12975, partial [Nocardioides sp.]
PFLAALVHPIRLVRLAAPADRQHCQLASTVDVIVHLDMRTLTEDGRPTRRRRVAEVIALDPGERETGYATTHVFSPGPDGTAVPSVLPDAYRALTGFGFDLNTYLAQQEVRS